MLATAIILFREVLEAALIIGIVAAATRDVAGRLRWITFGVVAGLAGAGAVAALADNLANLADGMGQEVFNAAILLTAVAMLAWHNIWMARHSRELVSELQRVSREVREGRRPLLALALAIAMAVLREGSEVVLFLYSQLSQGLLREDMLSGAVLGLLAGAATGLALYLGLLRIPARHLFRVTGWLILLLAAGMASQAVRYLVQADWLPGGGRVWDISDILSNDTVAGRVLHSLIGYDASPMGVQLAAYLVTLLLIAGAMRLVQQQDRPATR